MMSQSIKQVEYFPASFFGCRFDRLPCAVALALITAVAWLALIIALAKLARWLARSADLVKQMSELTEELDRLDSVVAPVPTGVLPT